MSTKNKTHGIETPVYHMIKHENEFTVIAFELSNKFIFYDNNKYRAVESSTIHEVLKCDKFNEKEIVKTIVQSASKYGIELLIIHYNIFKNLPLAFKSIESHIKSSLSESFTILGDYEFIPLTNLTLRDTQNLSTRCWKIIYLNKIFKTIRLLPIIKDWNIINSPYRYVFNDNSFDVGSKIIHLQHAINQLTENIDTDIMKLSSELTSTIIHSDFKLPDICLSFQYLKINTISVNDDLIERVLTLVARLATNGIINNNACILNLNEDKASKHINFNNYDESILFTNHVKDFGKQRSSIQSIINTVYKDTKTISSNDMQAFNCYIMYDVIRFLISIKDHDNINTSKVKSIIRDANNIMKCIYEKTPTYNNKLGETIDQLLEKHYKTKKEASLCIYKSQDTYKYEFLTSYVHQLDFSFNNNM